MLTKRLHIRNIESESDYESLLKLYQKKENMQYILSGRYDYTLEELKEKWKEIGFDENSQLGFQLIILKETNEIIGECALLKTEKPISEELEIAYMIDVNFWNKGFGTEICNYLIDKAFNSLKTKTIKAGMYKANINSENLIKKLGFTLANEGKSNSGIEFKKFILKKTNY